MSSAVADGAWLRSSNPIRRPASAGPSGTGRMGGGELIELGAQVEKNVVQPIRAARLTILPTCTLLIGGLRNGRVSRITNASVDPGHA
ncbi:MAG TPA: hypothetical protein VL524_11605 [Gemmatimonadaceae bacterium]|nr:hypothetical protein [Gemmatimonadaceae bacterium]